MPQFIESQSYGWMFNVIGASVIIGAIIMILRYTDRKKLVLIGSVPFILLAAYFMSQRLETRIDEVGINYRMLPFQTTENHIPWEQVMTISVTDQIVYNRRDIYSDLYVLNNNDAVIITLNNGKKVTIGTRDPNGVTKALNAMILEGVDMPKVVGNIK